MGRTRRKHRAASPYLRELNRAIPRRVFSVEIGTDADEDDANEGPALAVHLARALRGARGAGGGS